MATLHGAILEYCAPLTSFDWNDADPTLIGTCSVDTTCTMWDVDVRAPYSSVLVLVLFFPADSTLLESLYCRKCVPRRNSSHTTKKCMT